MLLTVVAVAVVVTGELRLQLNLLHLVAPHVQCQVIRARETLFAMVAPEGLRACMLPEVTSQLVRARKAPCALGPGANIRFLTWPAEHRYTIKANVPDQSQIEG